MKTLLRLCTAAVLAAVVTACGQSPTVPQTDVAPARMNGGWVYGGGHNTDGDTTTVNTTSSDTNATGTTTCLDERGPGIGGGSYVELLPCT